MVGLMDKDLKRQAVNAVTYLVTVVANTIAVVLPLNGLTTSQISDRFPVLVTPADYVFSIWSVIYLLLAVFTIYQALPRLRQDPELRAIGYLPAVAGILNTVWIVAWHFELFALTVPLMLGLLVTLIAIHIRLRPVRRGGGIARWAVALPFSGYLGWITVATIANIAQMLYWAGYRGEPLGEPLWALIILGAGVVIAAVMLLREADWAYALVIVWAYLGIAMAQTDIVAVVAAIGGAMIVGLLTGYVLLQPRLAPSSPAGSPS